MEKSSVLPTAQSGSQSQGWLGGWVEGGQDRMWEKPTDPFPSVYCGLASTAELLLGLSDPQFGKNWGKALAKLSRTAASCLSFLNGTFNFFFRTCWDIRRNRNTTVKNGFFITETKKLSYSKIESCFLYSML